MSTVAVIVALVVIGVSIAVWLHVVSGRRK